MVSSVEFFPSNHYDSSPSCGKNKTSGSEELVAQLVEHVTFNHRVLGSSPSELIFS